MATVVSSLSANNSFVQIQTDSPGTGNVLASFQGTTSATFVFEANNDGTNWFAIFALPMNTATTAAGGVPVSSYVPTSATNVAYIIPVYGYAAVRVRCSSYTSGTCAVALDISGNSLPWLGPQGFIAMPVQPEGLQASYAAGDINVTPVAAATDVCVLTGSSTKTLRVRQVGISVSATAAGLIPIIIKKHTVADTGSTPTTPSIAKLDSGDGAATAVVSTMGTSNPTVNASAIAIRSVLGAIAANTNATFIFNFGTQGAKPLFIKGVAQEVAINFNGATLLTGETFSYWFEWTEE